MKIIEANFNPIALLVRVSIHPATHPGKWGLTLEEARELNRQLSNAVAAGERYEAELHRSKGPQT